MKEFKFFVKNDKRQIAQMILNAVKLYRWNFAKPAPKGYNQGVEFYLLDNITAYKLGVVEKRRNNGEVKIGYNRH